MGLWGKELKAEGWGRVWSRELQEGGLWGASWSWVAVGDVSASVGTQHWSQEGLDVKAMMNTWTLQKGFPLITVTVRGRNVHVEQEHYMKGSDGASKTG